MCIGGGGGMPQTRRDPAPLQRRAENPISDLFSKRKKGARGVFGNIFTSPLGVTSRAKTSATTLGSGGAVTI